MSIMPAMDAQPAPMFSVIMPVYNHAAYLPEAAESVRRQTFGNWQLLIIDDGSTDGSGAIADRLAQGDERICVIHQPHAGAAAARNTGLGKARAEWLAFLDSDDLYLPSALQDFADFIAAHPDTNFIYGTSHRLRDGGRIQHLRAQYQDRPTGSAELFQRIFLLHCSLCFRRRLLEVTSGYNPKLPILEDYDFFLRMGLHTRFDPVGKVTALRRRHGTNISRQTGFSRMLEGAILRRFLDDHGGRRLVDPSVQARRLGKIYYAAGRQYFKTGYFPNAVEALKISLGYRKTAKAAVLSVLCALLAPLGRRETRPLPEF